MATYKFPDRAPGDVSDLSINWGKHPKGGSFLAKGEEIDTISVTITPDTLDFISSVRLGDVVTVWVEGGVAGQAYSVACRITTTQGRTYTRRGTTRCSL